MNILNNKAKTILVTGGAGFIGSHIVDKLIDKGYNVLVVDNLSTGNQDNINPAAGFYRLDIRNPALEKVFKENHIDYICHQAAQASVSKSTQDPTYDASVNIMGIVNLLNLARKYKVKKIVAASTAAIYGDPKYLPIDENHAKQRAFFLWSVKINNGKLYQAFGY